ncbi:MAG: hypothetical protein O3B01_25600 [Planctomycetota bacterium]|nr:hypothetical protein [Planctomycetota bacterium]
MIPWVLARMMAPTTKRKVTTASATEKTHSLPEILPLMTALELALETLGIKEGQTATRKVTTASATEKTHSLPEILPLMTALELALETQAIKEGPRNDVDDDQTTTTDEWFVSDIGRPGSPEGVRTGSSIDVPRRSAEFEYVEI